MFGHNWLEYDVVALTLLVFGLGLVVAELVVTLFI